MKLGTVSMRVALVLRSAEVQPVFQDLCIQLPLVAECQFFPSLPFIPFALSTVEFSYQNGWELLRWGGKSETPFACCLHCALALVSECALEVVAASAVYSRLLGLMCSLLCTFLLVTQSLGRWGRMSAQTTCNNQPSSGHSIQWPLQEGEIFIHTPTSTPTSNKYIQSRWFRWWRNDCE